MHLSPFLSRSSCPAATRRVPSAVAPPWPHQAAARSPLRQLQQYSNRACNLPFVAQCSGGVGGVSGGHGAEGRPQLTGAEGSEPGSEGDTTPEGGPKMDPRQQQAAEVILPLLQEALRPLVEAQVDIGAALERQQQQHEAAHKQQAEFFKQLLEQQQRQFEERYQQQEAHHRRQLAAAEEQEEVLSDILMHMESNS